jgi:hypothetical protein
MTSPTTGTRSRIPREPTAIATSPPAGSTTPQRWSESLVAPPTSATARSDEASRIRWKGTVVAADDEGSISRWYGRRDGPA